MIHRLQEIQSIYISQNRLVEGKDYVRAEWLKADIPIGITMMSLPINSKNFEFKRNWIQIMNSLYFRTFDFNTNYSYSYFIPDHVSTDSRLKPMIWNSTEGFSQYISSHTLGLGIHTIVANDNEVTISSATDTATLPWYGEPISIMFINATTENKKTICLTSFIKVDGVTRYVPCQLLKSIPSTLDANNIARTAGECGMYDSVSGKFYGNIASSGSFTVEGLDESETVEDTRLHQIYKNKLVEGEDYRCYDWIEKKSSAMGYMFSLTISNTADTIVRIFNYKAQGSNGKDMIYLNCTNGSAYFIYPNAAGQTIMRHSSQSTGSVLTTEQDVELKLRSGKVNNIYGFAYKSIGICPSTKTGNLTKVGRIYSDSYDYVPCKLLRAIPANRTMNGKSYPAGTMGMIEKVSKKFQPIANAATLTVSYDEWLKDCSIQIDMEQTLDITNYAPPTIIYKGRIDTTKLISELTDFGYVKISNTQIVCNQQTWSFSNWGSNKWATIEVSYGGNGGCNVNVNGTNIGSQTTQVTGIFNPHIFLYDIVQLNKIDYTFYPVQSDPTRSVNLIFSRGVDESLGKQYMTDNDGATVRIYAD